MALDLLLRQARLTEGKEALADIAIADGRIVEIADRIVADAPAAAVRLRTSRANLPNALSEIPRASQYSR
jgi:predicted amidohydrolase